MHIVLYDSPTSRRQFYPLSITRPIGELRQGLITIAEKWALITQRPVSCLSIPTLTTIVDESDFFLCVDATVTPDAECLDTLLQLKPGESTEDELGLIAFAQKTFPSFGQLPVWLEKHKIIAKQKRINHPLELILTSGKAIEETFGLVTAGRQSENLSHTNTIIGDRLFIEPGASIQACTINSTEGPVYIGKNVLLMEGTTIRGPVAIGEGAVVKMGTRLYPGSSIGPFCTVGGEVKNSIIHSYSNKAHDGYLGDSYIGAWCNLGAGTNCSNVKNTAGDIQLWQQEGRQWMNAGLKCGTIMGDYCRTAISTCLNSGTTLGVCCSIHSQLQPDKHLPSFSWGPGDRYLLEKALEHIHNWKQLKGQSISEQERQLLTDVYNHLQD